MTFTKTWRRGRASRRLLPVAGAILMLAVALAVVVPTPRVPAAPASPAPTNGLVTTTPITAFDPSDPTGTRFGDLVFLGGLVIASPDSTVAGLSGLTIAPDGRSFLAVSDYGFWVDGRILSAPNGRPLGIEGVRVAPLLAADGKPFRSKPQSDAEALTRRTGPGGRSDVLVSIEGRQFLTYPGPDPMGQRPTVRKLPDALRKLPVNSGIETLVVIPNGPFAGQLLAIAEGRKGDDPAIPAWILGARTVSPLKVARRDDYAVTDAAFLPGGDLVILERRFGLLSWFGARLRRIPAASLRPGAVLDGPVLWESNAAQEIDNMEGLAIHVAPDGSPILTLISDNNGMTTLQRTVLLRFRLVESATQ